MKFYAYIETSEGKEPLGTEGRILYENDKETEGIRRARRWATTLNLSKAKYNGVVRLFTTTNFYNDNFKQIL